jgi:hypothetical protein
MERRFGSHLNSPTVTAPMNLVEKWISGLPENPEIDVSLEERHATQLTKEPCPGRSDSSLVTRHKVHNPDLGHSIRAPSQSLKRLA